MAGKKSQKDKVSNKAYKAEMRWIKNKDRRQKQHETRLKRKDAHMESRAIARKTTIADIRWNTRRQGAEAKGQGTPLEQNPFGKDTTMGGIWIKGWKEAA